jgi:prophage regulatory protein
MGDQVSEQSVAEVPRKTALDSYPPIIRQKSLLELLDLSRTTVWRRVRNHEFPAPVKLGGPESRAVGWRREEVEQWLATRPRA